MPGPYTPPQPHRTQVVRSRRGASAPRWRWWWLVPAVGLVPLLAAVLATRGMFNSSGKPQQPIAAAPTQAVVAPTATALAAAAAQATSAPAATNATAPAPATASAVTATPVTNQSGASASATSSTSGQATSVAAPAAATASTGATQTSSTLSDVSASATAAGASAAHTASNANTGGPFVAYRVQSGDTVRFIARTYGVSAASIVQASGLSNPDYLRVGQVLTIPAQPGWLYRVQPGETLDQIAARTGVATDRIAAASGLSIASVGAGDVLLIPDQTAAGKGK